MSIENTRLSFDSAISNIAMSLVVILGDECHASMRSSKRRASCPSKGSGRSSFNDLHGANTILSGPVAK